MTKENTSPCQMIFFPVTPWKYHLLVTGPADGLSVWLDHCSVVSRFLWPPLSWWGLFCFSREGVLLSLEVRPHYEGMKDKDHSFFSRFLHSWRSFALWTGSCFLSEFVCSCLWSLTKEQFNALRFLTSDRDLFSSCFWLDRVVDEPLWSLIQC